MNRKYTEEHIAFIAANIPNCPFRELTKIFNERFGLAIRISAMISLADRHGLHNGRDARFNTGHEPTQFKKGQVSWNKGKKGISYPGMEATQFKKGGKSANWMPIGSERVNGDDYVDIKVQDGKAQKNWRCKHNIVWEAHHGQPVPQGHAVIFGDGNRRNFDPDNLILVSRAQLVRMNQNHSIKDDAELTRIGVVIADIQTKIGERKRLSRRSSKPKAGEANGR